jgi:DNA-binding beta-propeller fold protein YncE
MPTPSYLRRSSGRRSGIWRLLILAQFLTLEVSAQVIDSLAVFGTGFDVDVYGNLFVIDSETGLVTVFPSGTQSPVRQFGGQGWGNEQFDRPAGIWARNGLDIFVADYGNQRIQRYDRTLTFVSSLYTRDDPDPAKRFGYPTDVALTRLGDLYVCDSENSRILKLKGTTQVDISFGGLDAGKGRLMKPTQIEIGANDKVYVLDGGRVVIFDVFGNFLGELAAGLLRTPAAIFADSDQGIVLDGDMLHRFDKNDRHISTVNVVDLSGGRIQGREIREMVFSRGILYALTPEGMFLLRIPVSKE